MRQSVYIYTKYFFLFYFIICQQVKKDHPKGRRRKSRLLNALHPKSRLLNALLPDGRHPKGRRPKGRLLNVLLQKNFLTRGLNMLRKRRLIAKNLCPSAVKSAF